MIKIIGFLGATKGEAEYFHTGNSHYNTDVNWKAHMDAVEDSIKDKCKKRTMQQRARRAKTKQG